MTDTTNQQTEENNEPTLQPYVGKDRVFETDEQIETSADLMRKQTTPSEEASLEKTIGSKPEHNYKKRYDDLKSHYDNKLSEWRREKEELLTKFQSGKKTNVKMPKTAEELEKFKKEYPDVFAVVETVASMQADSRVQDVEEHLNILREREFELERQNAQRELLNHHSDFLEIKDTEDFIEWLKDQPDSISQGVTKNATDVKWAARTIDLYKADKGIGKSKTKSKKPSDAAKAVKTTTASQDITDKNEGKKIWTSEEIVRLKPHQFEKFEKEIDKARKEGRIR